jgi:bacterioferritin
MEDEQMHARNSKPGSPAPLTTEDLIKNLNGDLSREYQAIISYIVYSQSLKGPEFMTVADELEQHAGEELQHAIKIAKQIDYLGGAPTATAEPVKLTADNQEMLRADLESENETIRNYLERVKQCELLSEYATAETIREILIDEQDHQIALATALGISVPRVGMEGKGQ